MIKRNRSTAPSQRPRPLTADRLRDIRGGGSSGPLYNLKPTSVVASDDWEAPNQS